ncbi:MAG TPA: multicopper oxidase family protein, partial [Alphaproteobacteria bacterium]|nr:multicopper oxidase family protein [Alphaproteobacteria bacterium]
MIISRRGFLGTAAAAALVPSVAMAQGRTVVAKPGSASIVGAGQPATAVWAYDGQVPGPVLRFRQGERARMVVENRLPQPTTVHWHGLRLPNAMDGVPDLTQPAIPPGGRFVYEFDLPDAGTFWYHPHQRSAEQVGRGLAGAFIVDERAPVAVDRDELWVLDDWRLTQEAAIAEEFNHPMDASHAGRLGNTVTINGRVPERFAARAGERLRLRLINVSNARIFALTFEGHAPQVIAVDGHPVEPHAPDGGRVVLGPAMRADLLIDMTANGTHRVIDSFYPNRTYRLVDLVYEGGPAPTHPRPPLRLPDNPIPTPDLERAERHVIELGGGMMDPRLMRVIQQTPERRDEVVAEMRQRMQRGAIWTINGVAAHGHAHAPLLTLAHGRTYIFDLVNDTAWHHPMHLHGMPMHVL